MTRSTFRKKITSPELWEKVNLENKKLMNSFLKDKNTRSSATTVENYKSDLSIFFTWNLLENNDKFFVDIKKLEFAEFFSYCVEELKWNSAKFSRTRSCLSSLSIYIERLLDDVYPQFKNIILRSIESTPKVEVREKTVLSEDQINNLIEFLKNNKKTQQICWLSLAISSGARFSELLRFTTDLIDENNIAFNGLFLETVKSLKTKGRGRLGAMMKKYIVKDMFLPYYKEWLIERKKIMKENNQEHNFIFIREDGTPAREGTVRSWIKKYEDVLGVPFYGHCLRHYLVSHLTRVGLPSELIINIMGWKSGDAMYKIYNDVESKDRNWQELDKLEEHLNKNK